MFVIVCFMLSTFITCSSKNSVMKKFDTLRGLRQGNSTKDSPFSLFFGNNTDDESVEPKEYQGNCFMKMNNYFYDLYKIANKDKDMIINSKDGKKINFNLCYNTHTKCEEKRSLMQINSTCTSLAGERYLEKIWNHTSKYY
jgi:hypothetical protein